MAESDDHTNSSEKVCFFCGSVPPGSHLTDGKHGPICSACVFALSVRLTEEDRDTATAPLPQPPVQADAEGLVGGGGEMSVHDYQSRADLAVAYAELGKRHLAVEEFYAAMESALLCKDWPFALKMISKIRETADGPTVRDRIHEVLARNLPED